MTDLWREPTAGTAIGRGVGQRPAELMSGTRPAAVGAGLQHGRSVAPIAIVVPGWRCPRTPEQPIIFGALGLGADDSVQVVAETFLVDQKREEGLEWGMSGAMVVCEETRDRPAHVQQVPR